MLESTGSTPKSGRLHLIVRHTDQEGNDLCKTKKTVLRFDPTYANAKLEETMTIIREWKTNNGCGAPRPSVKYPAAAYIL